MDSVRLAMVTWNVGGGPSGITPGTDKLLRCARNADIIVVGLQEVGVGRRGWKNQLGLALGNEWLYVGGESYAGLRLRVFAHAQRGKRFQSMKASGMKVGAGFADRWPNKGAIAVEMRFAQTCRVLFVVAHLAANENQVNERQDDWRAILRRLDKEAFLTRGTDPAISVPLFHRYEHVFVLGDLNYRIEAPGTDREKRVKWVQDCVDDRDWDALIGADQLTRERLQGKVFANFQEAFINFPPTFKYDPRTGEYSSQRVPSYCDRVLWHSLPARVPLVHNLRYETLAEFTQSDHIPVVAEFQLDIPIITPPMRVLNATRGLRVVLEFMLVRYIKGRTAFMRRNSFADGPTSIRRIQQPQALRITSPGSPITRDEDVRKRFAKRDDVLNFAADMLDENGMPFTPDDNLDDFDDGDLEVDLDDENLEDDVGDEDSYSTSTDSSNDDEIGLDEIGLDEHGDEIIIRHSSPESDTYATVEEVHSMTGTTEMSSSDPKSSRKRSLDSGREYDETLLADMLTRHMSTSSSTDTSTPGETPSATPDLTPYSTPNCTPSISYGESEGPKDDGDSSGLRGPHLADGKSEIGSAHSQSVPRKRDSLSRQVHDRRVPSKSRRRSRLNGLRMEVHGHGLFLKQGRVYSVTIPKRRNGQRERIGESLPVIPLVPISKMEDLEFRHVLIEFARKKSRVGTSGALPLKEMLPYCGERYAFEMALTKYGQPVGTLEACVQLTIRDTGCWMDSRDRVVRNFDGGSSKGYNGSLQIRKKTSAKTKPDHGKWHWR